MRMIEHPVVREYLFFTPDKLRGQAAYRGVCALVRLKPVADGYGALLDSALSEYHAPRS
ncbi:hypothetical protein [Nocardiopsis dassonvillei]|uniref:hypothetical protein n=1 Tax=Nocardiopsis dassonvillei TaxID=2014 RepID=UPI0033E40586